jgi:hypothetical protein
VTDGLKRVVKKWMLKIDLSLFNIKEHIKKIELKPDFKIEKSGSLKADY